jgi:hypothetical protein
LLLISQRRDIEKYDDHVYFNDFNCTIISTN